MIKFIGSLSVSLALLVSLDSHQKAKASCEQETKGIYGVLLRKIKASGVAEKSPISCQEITKINQYDKKSLKLSNGSLGPTKVICISNEIDKPCKHIIGSFVDNRNPEDMLAEIFQPKSKTTCAGEEKGIYRVLANKITSSELASTKKMKCSEISTINRYKQSDLNITYQKNKGQYEICLSNSQLSPCRHILGSFEKNQDPSETLSRIFGVQSEDNATSEKELYDILVEKINSSGIAKVNEINIDQIQEINQYDLETSLITYSKKKGRYTICISDNTTNRCKHTIGTFTSNQNPSDMLVQVFDIERPKQSYTETVERLFFKPSLLID